MHRHPIRLSLARIIGMGWLLLLVSLACTIPDRPQRPEPPETGDAGEAEATEDAARMATSNVGAPAAIGSFTHAPHAPIECAACHGAPPGHERHPDSECTACHRMPVRVETASLVSSSECMNCHHLNQPEAQCRTCHAPDEAPTLGVPVSFARPTGGEAMRELIFSHTEHLDRDCAECHQGASAYQVVETGCASCHEPHHSGTVECARCHAAPPVDAHTLDAHLGCSGTGCHGPAVLQELQPSPELCLSCHSGQRDHEPGRACDTCHALGTEGAGSEAGFR